MWAWIRRPPQPPVIAQLISEAERLELRRLIKAAEAERDALQSELDEARRQLWEAQAERDEERIKHARMVSAADDLCARLMAAETERDEAQRDAREERLTLGVVAHNLRRIADEIETRDESQDDRPATDSGADGAGTTPE